MRYSIKSTLRKYVKGYGHGHLCHMQENLVITTVKN